MVKVELNDIISNAKETAKRDGYDQLVYLSNDGEYSFMRLYPGMRSCLWDMKQIVGFALYDYMTKTVRFISAEDSDNKVQKQVQSLTSVYLCPTIAMYS